MAEEKTIKNPRRFQGTVVSNKMNDTAVVGKVVEALANVGLMQWPADWVIHVVELLGEEDPLVARIRRGLRKSCVVDVVGRTPGEIGPVGPSFDDVVLEVILMDEHEPLLIRQVGELLQARPIPAVVLRQIVSAQTVKRCPLPAGHRRIR